MNNTRKLPQKSSFFWKNPYNATGLSDRKITSPIKPLLSIIKANFGNLSQNNLNFAARVGLDAAQKSNTHQKATASTNSCGFTLCN